MLIEHRKGYFIVLTWLSYFECWLLTNVDQGWIKKNIPFLDIVFAEIGINYHIIVC